MGIISQQRENSKSQGVFGVVAGARVSGKSTIPGTLPGKTLMLQADLLETGSNSALKLAKKLGNDLVVLEFKSYGELVEVLQDPDITEFDNVYIDGLSAITDQLYTSESIQKTIKKNVWDGFRDLWQDTTNLLLLAKKLSVKQNVFFTLAVKEKFDRDGSLIAIEPVTKGNATIEEVKKLCPTIVFTVASSSTDEEGHTTIKRQLVTSYLGVYSARIDSLLDDENPGIIDADLSKVINLIKGV